MSTPVSHLRKSPSPLPNRALSVDIVPDLHTTFSPSACVIAMLKPDGTVKIEKMQYLLTSLNDIKEDDRELIVIWTSNEANTL